MLVILLAAALFSRKLCPYDPDAQNLLLSFHAPSPSHPFGTDMFGRDMFSRVLVGGRVSIFATLGLVSMILIVGTAIGSIAGWKGGAVDSVLMRITDVFLSFPSLVFAMAIAGVLGGGTQNAVLALTLISWPKYARLARSQVLSLKDKPFVEAARVAGTREGAIIWKHILPNMMGPILVTAVMDIGTQMMELAGLSFLGLGTMPPVAEWGSMMSDARGLLQTVPWVTLTPGLGILVTVMIFNLFGDALRDWIDPKHKA